MTRFTAIAILSLAAACGDDGISTDAAVVDATDAWMRLAPPQCEPLPPVAPIACGTGPTARNALLPGAGDDRHDADLAALAERYDRGFHAIHAVHTGANTEVNVAEEAARDDITRFLREHDGWDFEAFAKRPVTDAVRWAKVAGAYAGVGFAADAFRYAVLRDEGAACEDVERARGHVVAALEGLHRATAITGTPGVWARGYVRADTQDGSTIAKGVVPLFDGDGNPLPAEKNNGTWRDDNSGDGAYSDYVWEDSCSRDMLIGWVVGAAALWEVVANDSSIDEALKTTLAADALALAQSLMQVGDQGFDLEIHDADGRLTFHAFLNEAAIDRAYVPQLRVNGQHSVMSLGIMAALGRISGDAAVLDYVYNDLVRTRGLHEIVRDFVGIIEIGSQTNYSNYNMTFNGAWLATRYLCDPDSVSVVRNAVATELYDSDSRSDPALLGQSFFDFVYVAAEGSGSAAGPLEASSLDAQTSAAISRGTQTLAEFPNPPFWDHERVQCDKEEIAARNCTLDDGTEVELREERGRGDAVLATAPVPMRTRPPSNFFWRSNPYSVNGGGSSQRLLPGVDFRFAYWMARYLTIQ